MEDMRKGVCPICAHNRIVQAWPVDHAYNGDFPVAATQSKPTWSGLVTMFGAMSTFTCRQCGYTQWFASAPADIPIGKEFNTSAVDGPEPARPYR